MFEKQECHLTFSFLLDTSGSNEFLNKNLIGQKYF